MEGVLEKHKAADAHDAGLPGVSREKRNAADAHDAGLSGIPEKCNAADAHDVGVSWGSGKNAM